MTITSGGRRVRAHARDDSSGTNDETIQEIEKARNDEQPSTLNYNTRHTRVHSHQSVELLLNRFHLAEEINQRLVTKLAVERLARRFAARSLFAKL